MRGKPPLLPCSPQREGVRKVQVCGSLHLAMLLVGALGAKIWLPAPCGHGEGFVSMGIPHLSLGMEPLGTGAQERGPPQHFCCDGLPVLFPPTAHTREAMSWSQDLLWHVQTWVAEAGFVLCPHPHLLLAKGSGERLPQAFHCPMPPSTVLGTGTSSLQSFFPPVSVTMTPHCPPRGCSVFGFH